MEKTDQPSQTPITDDAAYIVPDHDDLRVVEGLTEVVGINVARTLERELSAARRDAEITSVLFDGYSVYSALTEQAKGRTSPTNVSDVLDACVRVMRAAKGGK